MANTPVVVLDDTMTSIANAIRSKTGGSATMTPGQMPAQIASIPSGGSSVGIPRKVDNGILVNGVDSTSFSLPSSVTELGPYSLAYSFNNYSGAVGTSPAFETIDLSNIQRIRDTGARNGFYSNIHVKTVDLSSLTKIDGYGLQEAFRGCTALETLRIGNLTTVGDSGLRQAFYSTHSLGAVDLSSITTLTGQYALYAMFQGSGVASVDLSGLTDVSRSNAMEQAFDTCRSLTTVDLSSLSKASATSALSSLFANCSALTSFTFSALSEIKAQYVLRNAFKNCTSLTAVSFPALTTDSFGTRTDQFNNMLSGCSGVTVHFPAAIQSTIGSWSDVTNGFGGTNTTVLFDL